MPEWDFRVEGVQTISADLHKYGYAAKGASTLLHRSAASHAHQLFHFDDWPAGGMTTPTVAGTRPGGAIASAWAVLHYLGVEGYREKTRRALSARRRIARGVEALGLRVHGDPKLTLLAFGTAEGDPVPIFAVWKGMHDRGWFSGDRAEARRDPPDALAGPRRGRRSLPRRPRRFPGGGTPGQHLAR